MTYRSGLRLPEAQAQRLDALVAAGDYATFSEAMRAAIREFLARHETQPETPDQKP